MRLATPLAIVALAAALLAGCGSSSDSSSSAAPSTPAQSNPAPPTGEATAPAGASARVCAPDSEGVEALRAVAVSCGAARELMLAWQGSKACAPAAGASHSGCSLSGFRCVSVAAGRGVVANCSRRGQTVAFIAARG